MDRDTRNSIERATQGARRLLEEDLSAQLEGTFDVMRDGAVAAEGGPHLSALQISQRDKILAAIEHKRSGGLNASEAVTGYVRDAAFTTLNRFVALKMLEARQLLQECITNGEDSAGYREFCGLAPGMALVPDAAGYRLYIECLFDELSTEMKVLFDRRDAASVLWPKRQTFDRLLAILNDRELDRVWADDETIGWVYQFFNASDERRQMRDESQAPRNSRELAVRNQFFTPRYVAQFLTENTLGRLWLEMKGGNSSLAKNCTFLVWDDSIGSSKRERKDPRDLKVLDPACGSGHFLLRAFDLLLAIYDEAWHDPASPASLAGATLREDYPSIDALHRAAPALIVERNLYGIDIDARAVQIAALALWIRAQRAFTEFGVNTLDRARITRTRVVVAEPLPDDEPIARDFEITLQPPLLDELFRKMVAQMRLAGELGPLLKVEQALAADLDRARDQFIKLQSESFLPGMELTQVQESLDLSGVDADQFFHEAEGRIVAALRRLAESVASGAGPRRRLFANDAAQGIALIDLLRTHFDVVLMNPPFGSPTAAGQAYIAEHYRGAHNDIFAAFIRRARELCPSGYVGAITSRSFLVTRRLEKFRRVDFLQSVRLLWDLGAGVMDGALVESAGYVLGNPEEVSGEFLVADGRRDNTGERQAAQRWDRVSRQRIDSLPMGKVLYSLPDRVHDVMSTLPRFEPNIGTAREGMKSFDDFRFVRLWWEVEPKTIQHKWRWFAKGGVHGYYLQDFPLVLNWASDGSELRAVNLALNGSMSQVCQASEYWERPGATYSRRSAKGFSARALPTGMVFSTKGPAVLLNEAAPVTPFYLLGWLNSRFVRALIHTQANAADFLTGIIKDLPWMSPSESAASSVSLAVEDALCALLQASARRETSPRFVVQPWSTSRFDEVVLEERASYAQRQRRVDSAIRICDEVIDAIYGVDSRGWSDDVFDLADEDDSGDDAEGEAPAPDVLGEEIIAWRLLSTSLGIVLGRLGPSAGVVPEDAFGALDINARWQEPLESHLCYVVDDPGHPRDIVALVRAEASSLTGVSEDSLETSCAAALDVPDLRSFFRGAGAFPAWVRHLSDYSTARRKAPMYWRLSTTSKSYSVWLNCSTMTDDALFTLLDEVVEPRIRLEEQRVATSTQNAAGEPQSRRAAQEQETLLGELRTFRDELRLVAPLWRPDRDDGVLLNHALLWRLVPHCKPWQKELKVAWDALSTGEHDWSRLAINLWPERVVPKCVTDRSLAIAHGLEEAFWVGGADGKWTARAAPVSRVEELIRERTSPAVKAALKSMLEAPVGGGGNGPARRGALAIAASGGGTR